MFINIQFHQKTIYLSLLCYSPKMRYIFAEFLIVLIHSRKPGNGHLKFSGFFLKSWISRQHQNLGLRYVSVQGITAPYVGRYDNTYWLDILVLANYCSPGHQLLPLASPRTILGCIREQSTCYYPHSSQQVYNIIRPSIVFLNYI